MTICRRTLMTWRQPTAHCHVTKNKTASVLMNSLELHIWSGFYSRRLSADTRHCLAIKRNWEGTILVQRCSFSISQLLSPCKSSGQCLPATLESLMRCSHSNPLRQVSLHSTNPKVNNLLLDSLGFEMSSNSAPLETD